MNNQDVFNHLSELEEFFYYKLQNPEGMPWHILAQLHSELKTAVCQWQTLTGCKNEAKAE